MWEDKNLESLIKTIVSLQSEEEAQMFLRDLMTEAELKEFGRRWKAACMLHKKIPYTTIEKETGLSSATIARVSKWLQEGSGGYRMMLERCSETTDVAAVADLTSSIENRIEKVNIVTSG